MLSLNHKKFKCLKVGSYCSVGMIDDQYVFNIPQGFADIPVCYPISKEELDSFDNWKDDTNFKVGDILNREAVASLFWESK